MAPALQVRDVRLVARDGRVLLDVPALDVPPGQSLALRGPSGAGKSTLLHVLAGLARPDRGRVLWGGRDIAGLGEDARARFRRETLGLVFQECHLFEELSALGNAALVGAFAPPAQRSAIREAAGRWLRALGLGRSGDRRVDGFSGGERQRVAVARALATGPAAILADEPTAALDRVNADLLGADLARLAGAGGRTLIVVTHDAALGARMARRIAMADGRIAEDDHG